MLTQCLCFADQNPSRWVTLVLTCKDLEGNAVNDLQITVNNVAFPKTERGATRKQIPLASPAVIRSQNSSWLIDPKSASVSLDETARTQYLVITVLPAKGASPSPQSRNTTDRTPPEILWKGEAILKDPSPLLKFSVADDGEIDRQGLEVSLFQIRSDGRKPIPRTSVALEETFTGERIEVQCEFRPKQVLDRPGKYVVVIEAKDSAGNTTQKEFAFSVR